MQYIFIFLVGICVIHDLRSKEIPAIWIWLCIGTALGYRVYGLFVGKNDILECLVAAIPGILLLVFSYSSKQVGNGDGLLITAVGLYYGWEKIMEVLMIAFSLAATFAIAYILIKQKVQNARIPFIPFLFFALLACFEGGVK